MSGLFLFIIGIIVGGIVMTVITCMLQINKINELETEYINLYNQSIENKH